MQSANEQRLDFSGLVLGFSSAALSYLGEGSSETHLELARQNIDILELLAEKTKGNLASDEDLLLKNVLQDLKRKFIEKSKILL